MADSVNERLAAIVYGRVQGVGFRYQTERQARNLGLCGYVRNRDDGTVEVVAEGPRPMLERLRGWLETGPRGAYVSRVSTSWLAASGQFGRFGVRL